MRYETIYFDLDGTLTDSGPGITNSVAYALTRMGRPVPSRPSLNRYIGPPLWDSFRRYEAMTEAETQQAVALFREYYEQRGKFENAVYSGIPALLQGLREGGKRLVVATSKPEHMAVEILEHFELAGFFFVLPAAPWTRAGAPRPASWPMLWRSRDVRAPLWWGTGSMMCLAPGKMACPASASCLAMAPGRSWRRRERTGLPPRCRI